MRFSSFSKVEELALTVRNLDREHELHRDMEMGYLGFDSRRNSYDMELGYDSRGPSPMLSTVSSSTAPSPLHMPLPVYVPPTNFYGMNGMNFPRRPSSVPLPIPDFLGSYSMPGIALPSLHTLSRAVSPVGSIARHTQQHQHQHHQHLLQPFHNPFENPSSSTNDFQFSNGPLAPSAIRIRTFRLTRAVFPVWDVSCPQLSALVVGFGTPPCALCASYVDEELDDAHHG